MDSEPNAPHPAVLGEVVVNAADIAGAIAELPLFRRKWSYLAGAALLVALLMGLGHASLSSVTPFLVLTAIFQGYMFVGPRVMARRTLAAMPDHAIRYRADADELTIATTGSTVTRSWERITRMLEKPAAFLIWVGPGAVQVIPKRAFKERDLTWLREQLVRGSTASKARAPAAKRWRVVLLWIALVLGFLLLWQLLQSTGARN
jgi:hypothetical protein